MRSAVLFIDGQYLTHIERHYGIDTDYSLLATAIVRRRGYSLERIHYYTAPPFQGAEATEDENRRRAGYDRFIQALKRRMIIVAEGRCQRIGDTYTQKGVDTLLTMDLFSLPTHLTAFVLTGDTDFVPVISRVRARGVRVVLVYASEKGRERRLSISNELLGVSDDRIRINKRILSEAKR